MAVDLSKGGRVNLAKIGADSGVTTAITSIAIGLQWKPQIQGSSGNDFDLDASAFLVRKNAAGNDVCAEDDFIFYGLPRQLGDTSHQIGKPFYNKDKSVHHSGDNRKGDGPEQDDEVITLNLPVIRSEITKVPIIITIDQADARRQNFGQVRDAIATIYDVTNGGKTAIGKFDMTEDASTDTAMHVCDIYRTTEGSQDWKVNPVGEGSTMGLAAICAHFGLQTVNG